MHWLRSQANTAAQRTGAGSELCSDHSQAGPGRLPQVPTVRGRETTASGTWGWHLEARKGSGSDLQPCQKTTWSLGGLPRAMWSLVGCTWPGQTSTGQMFSLPVLIHTVILVTYHEVWFLAQELQSRWLERLACHHTLALGNKVGERVEKIRGSESSVVLGGKARSLN